MKKYIDKNSKNLFIALEVSLFGIVTYKLLGSQYLSLEFLFLSILNIIMLISLISFVQNK